MSLQHLVALCVLAFIVIIKAEGASTDAADTIQVEPRNPALALAARWIVKKLGKHVAKCAFEAAETCQSHWGHFHALVECAREFAKNNKGRCLA